MHFKSSKLTPCYILDNGAHTAKVGMSTTKSPNLVPNCIMKVKSERRRMFIGDQINECRDASGLFYILPFQKGYLVNWDIQKTLWDHIFAKEIAQGRMCDTPICITEPVFNFQSTQDAMDEIFYEEYDCYGILRLTAADLAAYQYSRSNNRCNNCLVIDTGYSFTNIVPYIEGKIYHPGIKRIDVGGKVLTNYLKEILSYRQLHVMDETYVINQVKEDACYVSHNFRQEMALTCFKDKRNSVIREYVLPDYSAIRRGYLRNVYSDEPPAKLQKVNHVSDNHLNLVNGFHVNGVVHKNHVRNNLHNNHVQNGYNNSVVSETSLTIEQTIVLNNERIAIPEILFHPSDIGIGQKGIAEAVVDCIHGCPPSSQYALLGNIVVCGGNAMFPNFKSRLFSEIKQRFDQNIRVHVYVPKNPITYPWFGGRLLAQTPDEFFSYMVSKAEYDELGTQFLRASLAKFKIGK